MWIYYSASGGAAAIAYLTCPETPEWADSALGESEEYFGNIAYAVTHPVETIESMAQSTSDTYEKEGLSYMASYMITDFLLGKAMGGAGKADDVTDVASAASKADDVADVASAASKADDVADVAGVAGKADDVADVAGVAGKTDDVADVADVASQADNVTKSSNISRNTGKSDIPEQPKVSYKRPSGYRKGVRDKVWESAKDANGNVIDPTTKKVIDPNEPWDMGHKPGYEFRKHKKSAEERGISRKEFIDEHNNPEHYRPELPSSNRCHAGEDKTDQYFGT